MKLKNVQNRNRILDHKSKAGLLIQQIDDRLKFTGVLTPLEQFNTAGPALVLVSFENTDGPPYNSVVHSRTGVLSTARKETDITSGILSHLSGICALPEL